MNLGSKYPGGNLVQSTPPPHSSKYPLKTQSNYTYRSIASIARGPLKPLEENSTLANLQFCFIFNVIMDKMFSSISAFVFMLVVDIK